VGPLLFVNVPPFQSTPCLGRQPPCPKPTPGLPPDLLPPFHLSYRWLPGVWPSFCKPVSCFFWAILRTCAKDRSFVTCHVLFPLFPDFGPGSFSRNFSDPPFAPKSHRTCSPPPEDIGKPLHLSRDHLMSEKRIFDIGTRLDSLPGTSFCT